MGSMASPGAAATQHAAYSKINKRKVRVIKGVAYMPDDFKKIEIDILRLGSKVPSRKTKGKIGHNWLLLDIARIWQLAQDESIQDVEIQVEELPAENPDILGNDCHANIVLKM